MHQFHVLLREINPPIWRRLLIRSDSTIADLHFIIQIAFRWTNFHLHRFLIRGQEYGIGRAGCGGFTTDARTVRLADFHFRRNERFLYEYDFGDLWQHQIRVEAVLPLEPGKTYPVCVGGARAAPPEDCGGPWAYMVLMDQHRTDLPLDEFHLVAEALAEFARADDRATIREVLGDPEGFAEAVERLEAYAAFRPESFDRREVTRRLKQYATGDGTWREQ